MRRRMLTLATVGALAAGGLTQAARADHPALAAPTGLTAAVASQAVHLTWNPVDFPRAAQDRTLTVVRDGSALTMLAGSTTSYDDEAVAPGEAHSYQLQSQARVGSQRLVSPVSQTVSVTIPAYLVGAATGDITPDAALNLGGFGLGDGSVLPEDVAGRGGFAGPSDSRIRARALVVDDGTNAVAIADIETQGMFAAYESGPYGLQDMAEQVARDIPGLPVSNILIASDHTHHGPDTIGAWGGVSEDYLQLVFNRTVQAIEEAYRTRQFASLRAGASEAGDLIYNQGCTEALNQDKDPTYPGPDVCPVPGKDGQMRVVQATAPGGSVLATLVVFAAHSTTNMGSAIDGDWPQFLGDRMAAEFGGVGIGMEGANGGTQPCRPTCSFTDPDEPGYKISDRRTAILLNYMAHVREALDKDHVAPVVGPVGGARGYIREAITSPTVTGLFVGGSKIGAPLMRSRQSPWMAGQTVRTVVSDIRIGNLLFNGTPGEGFQAIRAGVAKAVDEGSDDGPRMVIQLGLANDQLGYLIAPVQYVAPIAAEAAVNDNIIFNVSPTIGDHVMCADIRLASAVGYETALMPECAPYDGEDLGGDPLGNVPVGGITLP